MTYLKALVLSCSVAAWMIWISRSGIFCMLKTWSAGIFNTISRPEYSNCLRSAWFFRIRREKFPLKRISDPLRWIVMGELNSSSEYSKVELRSILAEDMSTYFRLWWLVHRFCMGGEGSKWRVVARSNSREIKRI